MEILNASLLWRWLDVLCRWVGKQWERSALVHWFLNPAPWGQAASENSVFFKLWTLVRGGLCRLYDLLKLDRLFKGSVFTHTWLWCAIPVVLAPLLDFWRPSIMVVGLALVGYCSLALNLIRDKERQLVYAPVNRYILLYAAMRAR